MRFRVLLFCTALLIASCGRDVPLAPNSALSKATTHGPAKAAPSELGGAKHFEGQIGPGALYEIDAPAAWNGDLVLYAHGYTLPQLAVMVPSGQDGFGGIRDLLLQRGFAVAVTSYSENGYAEAEGARQVHQLRGLFISRVAQPSRTFLLGQSLGGIISIELAEAHDGEYSGALIVSGVLGGTRRQVNYIGDTRAIFNCICPGVMPGSVTEIPPGPFPQDAVIQCLLSDPNKLPTLLCTFRDPRFRLPGTTGPQFVQSAVRVLGFNWLGANDLRDRTHGHELYDNHDVTFVGCVPQSVLDQINACVERSSSTPDAEAWMRHHYEPTGELSIPVLTVHAQNDPIVPAGHEAVYAEKAAATGSTANLLTCIYPRYGHTEAFKPPEVVQAFEALVGWAESGQKPAPPVFPTP